MEKGSRKDLLHGLYLFPWLQGVMRMHGSRGDRFIYLFEKALLIGKKHENTNLISIKMQITVSSILDLKLINLLIKIN